MQSIRIDTNGDFRCHWCGYKHFHQQRTLRAKVTVGFGALLTNQKLRCMRCKKYNLAHKSKVWSGPMIPARFGGKLGREAHAEWQAEKQPSPTLVAEPVNDAMQVDPNLQSNFDRAVAAMHKSTLPPPPPRSSQQ